MQSKHHNFYSYFIPDSSVSIYLVQLKHLKAGYFLPLTKWGLTGDDPFIGSF